MVKASAISKGMVNFVDSELLPKIPGLQKWIVGTVAGIVGKKADAIIENLSQNPLMKTLGIVDDNGNIDIEVIYNELSKQASKSPAVLSIPMVGDIKLYADDVESLYRHIMEV